MSTVLAIYGAGGFGREVLETALLYHESNRYDDVIFIVDNSNDKQLFGIKVYDLIEAINKYGNRLRIIIALGEPTIRTKIVEKVTKIGAEFETLIHPTATVSKSAIIGKGCYIAPFCFVSCNVVIGDHCVLQPHVNIGHDNTIGNNVNICGMTTIGGKVSLGNNVFVGMGAVVKEGCKIADDSIVSMGAVIFKDIEEKMIAFGNPARVMPQTEGQKVFK